MLHSIYRDWGKGDTGVSILRGWLLNVAGAPAAGGLSAGGRNWARVHGKGVFAACAVSL